MCMLLFVVLFFIECLVRFELLYIALLFVDSPPQSEITEVVHTPESSANVDSNLLTALKLTESPIKKQRTDTYTI